MPIATGLALGLGAASLAGAGISAGTSLAAAGEQSDAAKSAAQLQAKEAKDSLDFQKQQWNTTQANEAPWLNAGKTDLSNLQAILAEPGQGWGETFKPPTAEEAARNPGYQFSLQQGEEALENSAAARGALGSGNTAEALTRYAEGAASNNYTDVYNRAFNEYLQRYGQHNDQLNRLAAGAGIGQSTATTLGQQGQAAANNVGNINLTAGAQQGADLQNAAAATASGYVGAGNAASSGISNITNLLMLQKLFGGGGGGSLNPESLPGVWS